MEHELKAWKESFRDVLSGKKRFEIRIFDRPYTVGDTLRLREFDVSNMTDADTVRLAKAEDRLAAGGLDAAVSQDVEQERAKALAAAYTGREVRVAVTYVYANTADVPVHLAGYPKGTNIPQQVVVMGISIIKE